MNGMLLCQIVLCQIDLGNIVIRESILIVIIRMVENVPYQTFYVNGTWNSINTDRTLA